MVGYAHVKMFISPRILSSQGSEGFLEHEHVLWLGRTPDAQAAKAGACGAGARRRLHHTASRDLS